MNISRYFDAAKANFAIRLDDIDDYIKDLILEINQYEDIVTSFSCEGHENGKYDFNAYLAINISPKIWDQFWTELVPKYAVMCNAHEKFAIRIDYFPNEPKWNRGKIVFRNRNPHDKFIFWGFLKTTLLTFLRKYSIKHNVEFDLTVKSINYCKTKDK